MSVGRYMLLKCAVDFGVFLVTCPLAFLLMGGLGSTFPENSFGVAVALVGFLYIIGSIVVTHVLTEKLSKRWSR